MSFKIGKIRYKLNLYQIIALAFLGIILLGTLLLSLPFARCQGTSFSLKTSLFTATSAVCVTGLSTVDIWTTYSFFGQLVLLALMEVGGLGFMSIVSILIHLIKHSNGVDSLSLMAESLGNGNLLSDVTRIQKRVILGSVGFEMLGALVLTLKFSSLTSLPRAIWFGLFHSVSAFCNAGFDLMGYFSPGSSLTLVCNSKVVLITIALLITIGGIGFIVWDDLASSRHFRDWSIYTKIVLSATGLITLVGFALFLIFEFNNPNSLGPMSLSDKIVNALFQAVTPRTAGFASISQDALSDKSIALTSILMMIGGSTGSTAGGIKTVTFIIIVKTLLSNAIDKKSVNIFKRTISFDQITNAYTVAGSFILLSVLGSFIICLTSSVSFTHSLFESISALATVGLSLNTTASLSTPALLVLIVFMYIGRVGLLTLTMGFLRDTDNTSIKYPTVDLLIG